MVVVLLVLTDVTIEQPACTSKLQSTMALTFDCMHLSTDLTWMSASKWKYILTQATVSTCSLLSQDYNHSFDLSLCTCIFYFLLPHFCHEVYILLRQGSLFQFAGTFLSSLSFPIFLKFSYTSIIKPVAMGMSTPFVGLGLAKALSKSTLQPYLAPSDFMYLSISWIEVPQAGQMVQLRNVADGFVNFCCSLHHKYLLEGIRADLVIIQLV